MMEPTLTTEKLPLRVNSSFSATELEKVFGVKAGGASSVKGVCLDSRVLEEGDLFFALQGARDGHEFVGQVFQKGAAAAVVEKNIQATGALWKVKDVSRALQDLAKYKRTSWGKKLAAISGSNGKTTTKEMTHALLDASGPALKSPGTWNNNLGVPLTLLMLEKKHAFAVLEMGMNHLKEIEGYCEMAMPDVAVLTNIGHAHVGELGSLENVAIAKAELFHGLGSKGIAVVNADDPKIVEKAGEISCKKIFVSQTKEAEVCIRSVKKISDQVNAVRVLYGESAVELEVPYFAKHLLSNFLCALGVAYAMEVPVSCLQKGADRIQLPKMRLGLEKLANQITLVDDSYNANPDSVRVALQYAHDFHSGRKIAVLGDMLELGSLSAQLHREIGKKIAELGFEKLLCVGQFANNYVEGAREGGMKGDRAEAFAAKGSLIEKLLGSLARGDCVVVKGSRGSKMEEISMAVRQNYAKEKLD